MLQMGIYSDVDCRSQNVFQKMNISSISLLKCTAKLSVLCLMLIGVFLSLNGTAVIACVSAVHILYELCTVKWQSASSPVAVDLKEKQKLNI